MTSDICSEFRYAKQFVEVRGSRMTDLDTEGEGEVVLFLQGSHTLSRLWRNVIPYVSPNHRVIALVVHAISKTVRSWIETAVGGANA